MVSTERVKEVLGRETLNLSQVCARLDIPEADAQGKEQVRKILGRLVKSQQANILALPDRTVFRLREKPGFPGEVQEKLWRAMCLKAQKRQPFTAADIIRLVECDRTYATRYLRFCLRQRYLIVLGRRRKALTYQVVSGKEREAAPRWNRRAEKKGRAAERTLASGMEAIDRADLKMAMNEFSEILTEIVGGCARAAEIVREIQETLQAAAAGGEHGISEGEDQQ